MAAIGNTWIETKKGVEHFLQGKHLQSDGWDGPVKYEYIPDSKVLGESKSDVELEGRGFKVKTLVHATKPEAAVDVLVNGFKPNRKFLGLQFPYEMNTFVWWGISPDRKDTEKYSERCEKFTKKFMIKKHTCNIDLPDRQYSNDDAEYPVDNEESSIARKLSTLDIQDTKLQQWREDLNGNFCSSPPFCVTSRYGNVIFEYNIDQLTKAYSSQYCDNKDPEFRVLGTFAFAQEVMHAVLVCPPDVIECTAGLPLIDKSNSVIYRSGYNWIWTPETTGSRANYYKPYDKKLQNRKFRTLHGSMQHSHF